MYGTTEEVFFTNWDFGGAYWEKKTMQNCSTTFNPMTLVKMEQTYLIIKGGKDFRVPIGQGRAFQAANYEE
jgi:hypothetical protein